MVNAYAAQCLAPFAAVHDKLGLIPEGICRCWFRRNADLIDLRRGLSAGKWPMRTWQYALIPTAIVFYFLFCVALDVIVQR
jgi:hypothetical protein